MSVWVSCFERDRYSASPSITHRGGAKEKGLIRHVYVMGCLSERYKKDLEKEIRDVDRYFGVNDIKGVIKQIGLTYDHRLEGERHLTTPGHYAYLKISEGCDRKCAFCAIPLIRGRHHSKSLDELVRETAFLVSTGVKEVMLIAQDTTSYGTDLSGQKSLGELLERISSIEGLSWIRLHYTYPAGFPEDVLSVMNKKDNICKYLDIPIQHVSDKMLKIMKRGYGRKQLTDLIGNIRSQVPGIVLRTTVLTGHPGEGDREFQELSDFLDEVRFDRLGVFVYSAEEGTSSFRLSSPSLSAAMGSFPSVIVIVSVSPIFFADAQENKRSALIRIAKKSIIKIAYRFIINLSP